jgi:hypothetical protein
VVLEPVDKVITVVMDFSLLAHLYLLLEAVVVAPVLVEQMVLIAVMNL